MRTNNLAKSAIKGSETPKINSFRYCVLFYDVDGQGPMKASAEVDIHASWSMKLQLEACDVTQPDYQDHVDPNKRYLEQQRCKKSHQREYVERFSEIRSKLCSLDGEDYTQGVQTRLSGLQTIWNMIGVNDFGLEKANPSLKKMTTREFNASDSTQKNVIIASLCLTHLYSAEKEETGEVNTEDYMQQRRWKQGKFIEIRYQVTLNRKSQATMHNAN